MKSSILGLKNIKLAQIVEQSWYKAGHCIKQIDFFVAMGLFSNRSHSWTSKCGKHQRRTRLWLVYNFFVFTTF